MPILPLLKNPDSYSPATWPLTIDNGGIEWWTSSATRVAENLADHERHRDTPDIPNRVAAFTSGMTQLCQDIFNETPARHDIDCFELDSRFSVLTRRWALDDAYAQVKARENDLAADFYLQHIRILDALDPADLPLTLIRGVLAGNRFDLGCGDGVDDHHNNSPDFEQTIAELTPRPWAVDDYDAFAAYFRQRPRKVLFFVDNAGADFTLGCLPLARALADRGATVVIAANSTPIVNDITAAEAQTVLDRLAALDARLAELIAVDRLKVIDSGSHESLIDLTQLSDHCVSQAADADLLILEGMGRGLESNFFAQFTCPTLKICLLKAHWPAAQINAKIFDVVCRFEA